MNGEQDKPAMTRLSLRDQYARPRRSQAWEIGECDIVRFWADDGNCYGFLFHHVMSTVYLAQPNRLFIQCPLGALVISGLKVLDFYEDFSNRKVTVLKADGADITLVEMLPRTEKEE